MIVPRLVLGTARIAGGASEREAVDLVKSAFGSGIRAVDTAPSYGLGTAEKVVGRALVGHPEVEVTTKLGSRRPAQPYLSTFARRIKRLLGPATQPAASLPPARIESPSGNDYFPVSMAQSLEISGNNLGRIDIMLLHDITPGEATGTVLGELARLAGSRPSGYASLARWDPELDHRFAEFQEAQCAPDPAWLLGTGQPPQGKALRLHSLVKTGLAIAQENAAFGAGLERAAAMIAADRMTARIAAIYALAAIRIPQARLLFASSHQARLKVLTKALEAIDNSHQAAEIATCISTYEG